MKNLVIILAGLMMMACAQSEEASFSLGSTEEKLSQSFEIITESQKVDVLWVIDNSGSMKSSQEALAANFESFSSKFIDKDYDFQMAITTTDAYKDSSFGGADSQFVGGIMDKDTPNFVEKFTENVQVGTGGNTDERGQESVETALENRLNSGLLREGAKLAIVFLSDEDDTSKEDNEYYYEYLKDKTNSTDDALNFSVSTISITDEACRQKLGSSVRKVGKRYNDLAAVTNGTVTSLCDDFSDSLSQISDKITKSVITKISNIKLNKTPIRETLKVFVNDSEMPESVDGSEGWIYNSEKNEITFTEGSVPEADAQFRVSYTPNGL